MTSPFDTVEPSELRARLQRFVEIDPEMLIQCAALSPRIAQLATAFPLVFAMLATGCGPSGDRETAMRLANDGRHLRDIAAALSVPCCLRRLPPEACPQRLAHFGWSLAASRRLRSFVPHDARRARHWLPCITFAAGLGDEPIALWLAGRHELAGSGQFEVRCLQPLVLFAWISRHQPTLLGHCVPWSDKQNARNAVTNCTHWLNYVAKTIALGPDGVPDPWIEATMVGGLSIVPLITIRDIAGEAHAMGNCR